MPLTAKGEKIKREMEKEYGSKKGKSVFYAMENSGKLKGVKKHHRQAEQEIRALGGKRGRIT